MSRVTRPLPFLRRLSQATSIYVHAETARINQLRRGLATASVVTPDGPAVAATDRADAMLKRFWKHTGVESSPEGLTIALDKRPIKTPSGRKLVLPHRKQLAATMIAAEWESEDKVIKTHALPMTSLASRAVDGLSEKSARDEARATLLKYLDTDTICFHETEPRALVALQDAHWKPLLSWTRDELAVEIIVFESLLGAVQPQATKDVLNNILMDFDEWQMAAFERATYTTKSFIIALALISGKLNVDEAALAASVEVNSQIQRWGEVEDTHDVDYHDVRRQLGSAACLISDL